MYTSQDYNISDCRIMTKPVRNVFNIFCQLSDYHVNS